MKNSLFARGTFCQVWYLPLLFVKFVKFRTYVPMSSIILYLHLYFFIFLSQNISFYSLKCIFLVQTGEILFSTVPFLCFSLSSLRVKLTSSTVKLRVTGIFALNLFYHVIARKFYFLYTFTIFIVSLMLFSSLCHSICTKFIFLEQLDCQVFM